MFCIIGVFLDSRFVECVWVHLRRNHNNSSVVIQMTGILYEFLFLGLDFAMILLLLMNLHEIQMLVTWQLECFVPICNVEHDTRIVDNLGKFIFVYLHICNLVHSYIWSVCTLK